MSERESIDRASAALVGRQTEAPKADGGAAARRAPVMRDDVEGVSRGARDAAHAQAINHSMKNDAALAQRSLLGLQARYGNRYVGRVIDRASNGAEPAGDMASVERSIDASRSGGSGMDHGTRTRMETAFGADFSGVRIHHDSHSDDLSRSLSARAFATGRDVYFRQGEYNPGTSSGRELLAHELTHVVQQTGGVQRKMTVSQPNDPHEVEADRMAQSVMQQEQSGALDRQIAARAENEKDKRDDHTLARQPEAPRHTDEEDKHELHKKPDAPTLARAPDDDLPE